VGAFLVFCAGLCFGLLLLTLTPRKAALVLAAGALVAAGAHVLGGLRLRLPLLVAGTATTFAFLGVAVGPFGCSELVERWNRTDFDSAAWKATDFRFSADAVRIRMVDDLLRSHDFAGMTRERVLSLLGPDDREGFGAGYFPDWDLVYWLGPERGWIRIDSEWLVLRLGPDDRVVEHRLVTD
jgi:hypothetical protein